MKNKKGLVGNLANRNTLLVIALIVLLFVFAQGDFQTGMVKRVESGDTYYSYHGRVPIVSCGSSDCPHPFLYEQEIDFHGSDSGYFPYDKVITVGSDNYRFTTTNTVQASLGAQGCSAMKYKVVVYKNDVIIDTIDYTSDYGTCAEYQVSNSVVRNYDGLKVTFNEAFDIFKSPWGAGAIQPYLIHKYEVGVEEESTTPDPDLTEDYTTEEGSLVETERNDDGSYTLTITNSLGEVETQTIDPKGAGIFSTINNWIGNVIDFLFGWLR